MLKCEHCEKLFAKKGSLTVHVKGACPILREKTRERMIDLEKENAELKQENAALIKEAEQLREQMDIKIEMARKDARLEFMQETQSRAEKLENHILRENSKPRISNTTLNISPYDFSREQVEAICKQYSIDDFNAGPEATYKFIMNKHLKDEEGRPRVKCTDTSRKIFRGVTGDGEEYVDVGGKKVIKAIRGPMQRAVVSACSSIDNITDEEYVKKLTPHQRVLEPSRLTRRLSSDLK